MNWTAVHHVLGVQARQDIVRGNNVGAHILLKMRKSPASSCCATLGVVGKDTTVKAGVGLDCFFFLSATMLIMIVLHVDSGLLELREKVQQIEFPQYTKMIDLRNVMLLAGGK